MTYAQQLLLKTRVKVQEIGIRKTFFLILCRMPHVWRYYRWQFEEWQFDWANELKTRYVKVIDDINSESYESHRNHGYDPTRPSVFFKSMRKVPIDHSEFAFVDLGSGKGRMLLLASHFSFRRVTGVELTAAFHEMACRNIRQYTSRFRRCPDVQSLHGDAAEFRPGNENLVLFMFNPFGEDVLRQLLENLRTALERYQRQIFIVYANPLHRCVIDNSGFMTLIHEEKGYDSYTSFCVYSSDAPPCKRVQMSGTKKRLRILRAIVRPPIRLIRRWYQGRRRRVGEFVVKGAGEKGVGIFAIRAYSPGERVLFIQGRVVQERSSYSIQIYKNHHIEPNEPARLVNHSCDPNCGIQLDPQNEAALYARRRIHAGEEISWDYAMSESDFCIGGVHYSLNCCCGAATCRGRIERGWNGLSSAKQLEYSAWSMPYLH